MQMSFRKEKSMLVVSNAIALVVFSLCLTVSADASGLEFCPPEIESNARKTLDIDDNIQNLTMDEFLSILGSEYATFEDAPLFEIPNECSSRAAIEDAKIFEIHIGWDESRLRAVELHIVAIAGEIRYIIRHLSPPVFPEITCTDSISVLLSLNCLKELTVTDGVEFCHAEFDKGTREVLVISKIHGHGLMVSHTFDLLEEIRMDYKRFSPSIDLDKCSSDTKVENAQKFWAYDKPAKFEDPSNSSVHTEGILVVANSKDEIMYIVVDSDRKSLLSERPKEDSFLILPGIDDDLPIKKQIEFCPPRHENQARIELGIGDMQTLMTDELFSILDSLDIQYGKMSLVNVPPCADYKEIKDVRKFHVYGDKVDGVIKLDHFIVANAMGEVIYIESTNLTDPVRLLCDTKHFFERLISMIGLCPVPINIY